MSDDKRKFFPPEMRDKIMKQIREKKIRIQSPSSYLAKKLGLESILATVLILGALMVSVILYFLKRTGVLKFLDFGIPGLKVVILTLPYDYIAFFILTIILAVYLFDKLDFHIYRDVSKNTAALILLLITVLAGIFFASMGAENFFKGWSDKKIPGEMAISGKISDFSNGRIVLIGEDGSQTEVLYDDGTMFTGKPSYAKGKVLRAVGYRVKKNNQSFFHADRIQCCDDN